MDRLHATHLVVLGSWALLVVVESALELGARTDPARRRVARLHYWLDLPVEAPLIVSVLATGVLLTIRAWPPSALLVVKIVCALTAIALNAYCMVHVVLRHRRADDPEALARHRRRVMLSGLGIPPALVAAYIGLAL